MADTGGASQLLANPYARPAYRWQVLFVLFLIYAVHSMDRGMPGILIEPVRHEFHLKDSQLGLFIGAFWGVGTVAAVLPMGYLADRLNRRALLSAVMVVWSACTALGGVAVSFGQLLATRAVVGVAESGANPIILPLLIDIFPRERRSLAMGLLFSAPAFGGVLASGVGGLIAASHGWRAAMLLAGLPGLILAVVVMVFVREPGRGASDGAPAQPPPRIGEVVKFLVGAPALLSMIGAGVLIGWTSISMVLWNASFYMRVHHLHLAQVAGIQSLTAIVVGPTATPLFGWIADKVAGRSPHLPVVVTMIICVVSVAAGLAWLYAPFLPLVIAFGVLGDFMRQGYVPLLYPVMLGQTPPHTRGAVMSVQQVASNLGFIVGPPLIGQISDMLGGGTAIRTAMACAFGLNVVAIALLVVASALIHARRQPAGPSGLSG